MFCPECGKELSDDSVFCEYCGARVDDGEEATQEQPVRQQSIQEKSASVKPAVSKRKEKKDSSDNKALTVIGALVLVAIIGGLLFYGLGKQTEKEPDIAAQETSAVTETPKKTETLKKTEEPKKTETPKKTEVPPKEEPEAEPEPVEEKETGSLEIVTPVEPKDFNWVGEGLSDAMAFSDLEKASGKWKCLIHADATEKTPERYMFTEADIQYHGNTVTIYMDVVSRFELIDDVLSQVDTDSGIVVTYDGKWDEASGSIEAKSRSSELRFVIDKFGDTGDAQYAIGDAINKDNPIGAIYLVRP